MAGMRLKKVLDKIPRPPGAIPRQAQNWIIGGVTAVIVIALLAFPGQPPVPAGRESAPDSSTADAFTGVPPDVTTVNGAASRIRDNARKDAELRVRAALGAGPPPDDGLPQPPGEFGPGETEAGSPAGYSDGYAPPPTVEDSIREQERLRRYESLRAPVLVQTSRAETNAPVQNPPAGEARASEPAPSPEPPPAPVPAADSPHDVVLEGEFIEAVLANRLSGEFSGPVNAIVSASVWDRSRQRVLIPRGTRALGNSSRVEAWDQSRLAITFHRLILPGGQPLDLAGSPGLSQAGETGLKDRVDRHYPTSLLAAGAVGALAGLSQAVSPHNALLSRTAAMRASAGSGLSQSALRILDRYLNRLPRITIREGHRIRIYLTSDLRIPRQPLPAPPAWAGLQERTLHE